MAQVQVGRLLGGGASGDVYAASVLGTPQMVALKVFRSDVSPDGRTMDEVALSSVVRHPNLPRVRAVVPSSPQSPQIALIMDLVPGGPLADKPNSASLLRCRWPDAALKRHGGYPARGALEIARGVASALAYLHAMGVAHGDVYAHNVLVETHLTRRTAAAAAALAGGAGGGSQGQLAAYGLSGSNSAYASGYRTANGSSKQDNSSSNQAGEDAQDGDELTWHATLCDLGAAFCYERDAAGGGGGNGGAATGRGASFWEATEARAYGLLVKDLLERADKRPPPAKPGASRAATAGERKEARESLAVLGRVARECLSADPRQRPTFRAVLNSIDAVSASHAAARAKRRAAAAAEAAVRAKAAREKAAKDQAKAEKAAREAALKAEKHRAEMERRNAAELEKARKKAGALDVSAYARLYGHSAR
jgi:serine/threonine protein kinase